MKRKFPKIADGGLATIDLGRTIFRDACCDCGLVHLWLFQHVKGNTWKLGWVRDKRATGQLRRHKYGSLQQDGRLKI